MKPTIGRIVIYRTDGRNGLVYDLPAIVTCTKDTHPGNYPDGSQNPLPVPESDDHVHLTVFTPGGFGTIIQPEGKIVRKANPNDKDFIGGSNMRPGSGTYVEWNVPYAAEITVGKGAEHRTWRWPERVR
jgi:hypothetical protein